MAQLNNLDPLPPSDDEYFTKYEAETNKFTLKETTRCEHYFVRTTGIEAECKKCHIGFYITPEYVVSQGKLIKNGQIVI